MISLGEVCKENHVCKDCDPPYGSIGEPYYTKTCNYKDTKLKINYKYNYKATYKKGEDDNSEVDSSLYQCEYISFIDPCECLTKIGYEDLNQEELLNRIGITELSQAELSNHYCLIDTGRCEDDSDICESVEGWYWMESLKSAYEACRQGTADSDVADYITLNAANHTCRCGNAEIPVDAVGDYSCDMGLQWRCNNAKGCACGESSCEQSQICMAPGVCSR